MVCVVFHSGRCSRCTISCHLPSFWEFAKLQQASLHLRSRCDSSKHAMAVLKLAGARGHFCRCSCAVFLGVRPRVTRCWCCARLQDAPNDGSVQFAMVTHLSRRAWFNHLDQHTKASIPRSVVDQLHDIPRTVFPSQPTGVYPFVGWLWSDFVVHSPEPSLLFSPGRGFKFGKPVTQLVFREAGVIGMIRAHQHNGEMLDALRSRGGLVDNWHSSGACLPLTPQPPAAIKLLLQVWCTLSFRDLACLLSASIMTALASWRSVRLSKRGS
jgi:hypothetical protein